MQRCTESVALVGVWSQPPVEVWPRPEDRALEISTKSKNAECDRRPLYTDLLDSAAGFRHGDWPTPKGSIAHVVAARGRWLLVREGTMAQPRSKDHAQSSIFA